MEVKAGTLTAHRAWNILFHKHVDMSAKGLYGHAVPLSAKTVANEFLKLAQRDGKALTNMQVQKLVYIAHGFNLAIFKAPLVEEQVKAWPWGPVIPPLYNRLKKYGNGPISGTIPDVSEISQDDEVVGLIARVWKGYGDYSGARLSAITHQTGSPWDVTWRTEEYGVIDDALTAQHYRTLLAR